VRMLDERHNPEAIVEFAEALSRGKVRLPPYYTVSLLLPHCQVRSPTALKPFGRHYLVNVIPQIQA